MSSVKAVSGPCAPCRSTDPACWTEALPCNTTVPPAKDFASLASVLKLFTELKFSRCRELVR